MTEQDLITVEFVDNTNYQSGTSVDTVGCPIDHIWGPVNRLQRLPLDLFLSYYPEYASYSWATINRAFSAGAQFVETVRPQGTDTYLQFLLTENPASDPTPAELEVTGQRNALKFPTIPQGVLTVSTRYPGTIPPSLMPYDKWGVSFTVALATDNPITIQVIGYTESTTTPGTYTPSVLEVHQGGFTKEQIVDGQPFYIEDVLRRNSRFFDCQVAAAPTVNTTEALDIDNLDIDTTGYVHTPLEAADFTAAYTQYYSSTKTSETTIILPALSDNTVYDAINALANARMDANALVGFPVDQTFDNDTISEQYQQRPKNMFSFYYAARESVTVANTDMLLDGLGTIAGRFCAVTQNVRLNQPPSADAYGSFPGVLTESLNFNQVLTLHQDGIGSVYNSTEGPQIWNIKSMHSRQNSYFARNNVMRVTSAVLKFTFRGCYAIIHTDVAANNLTREQFQTSMQSVLDRMIAAQNLRPQSTFVVSEEINTDAMTQGGRILNIDIYLWFIGLTERVHVRVIATDSIVSASIVQ